MFQEWLKDYEKLKEENNMSEEEIIKYIKDEIENEIDTFHWFDNTPKNETRRQIEESIKAHQGLLDLYTKEQEKNKELENKIKEYEKIFNRQKELEQEKNNLMKQGWL